METPRYTGDIKVVSIGEILWDVIGNQRHAGGAPFNFAYHAVAAGAHGLLVSRVSHDDLGADLVHRAESLGVDISGIQRAGGYATGIVTAEIQPGGEVHYVFPDECAWDHIHFTERERNFLDDANIVAFGTLAQRNPTSRAAIMAALANTPPETITFLDLNLRAPFYNKDIITASLGATNILKLNQNELTILQQELQLVPDNEGAILHLMERYDLDTVVLTRGAEGAIAWNRSQCAEVPGFEVPVADTVGCGDAFAANFAVQLACGSDLYEAMFRANLAGAYVATNPGGTPIYGEPDILRFYNDSAPLPVPRQRELPLASS